MNYIIYQLILIEILPVYDKSNEKRFKRQQLIESLFNDVSYSIDTHNIGAHEFASDGGWITNNEHNSEGRILQEKNGSDAVIHIDDVSENLRFAIEQIDDTGYALKSIRIPDNGLSNKFSVIEVEGLDRQGLLAELAEELSNLNLDIGSAQIVTFGEKAVDTFYVTDLTGHNITDGVRRNKIRDALMQIMG